MKLAPDFVLPIDALSVKLAILATSGAGKTNTGTVIVEETLDEKGQVVIVDPQGDWWGIRSSADGKHEGYPVLVMGGPHGDVALHPTTGKLVADLVVDERLSVVLDTSDFSNADHIRFCTDFATQLFARKNVANTPLLLICEEAEAVAPQQPFGEETRMLAIFQRIAKRGRRRGINILPISQRSASVNKNFLSQCRGGILMQTVGTQDRKAVDEWLQGYDTEGKRLEIIKGLAALETGEGVVWIPQLKIFRKVHFRKRRTFDSSATPKQGEVRIEPKKLAPVDLERINKAMLQVVQKERENDPKILRQRIAELERDLRSKVKQPASVQERVVTKTVQVAVLPDGYEAALAELLVSSDGLAEAHKVITNAVNLSRTMIRRMPSKVGKAPAPVKIDRDPPQARLAEALDKALDPHDGVLVPRPQLRAYHENGTSEPAAAGEITKAQRKLLDVLAWWRALGYDRVSREALAVIAGYSPSAGGFNNYLGKLRTAGLIDYPEAGKVSLTADGAELADPGDVPNTPEEVQQSVYRRLPAAKAKLLQHLVAVYPDPLTREELAKRAEYSPTAGGFNNYLGSLRTLRLIDYPGKGQVRAEPVLFLEAAS